MGAALNGNLKDFGIAEVFQLVGQQRKTGVLEVANGGRILRIAFDGGAIVAGWHGGPHQHEAFADMLARCGLATSERASELAQESLASARSFQATVVDAGDLAAAEMDSLADLLTEEVVFEVIRWKQGSFHFSAQPVEHDRTPDRMLAAEQILMDGLRKVDEWASFAHHVPSEDSVFARAGSFELFRQAAKGHDRSRMDVSEQIHQLVDGRLSARRIIDLTRVGTFDGTRVLAALVETGAISLADPAAAVPDARPPRLRRGVAGVAAGLRVAVAAAVPLAVLGAALWLSGNRITTQPALAGAPIELRSFERAVAAFEARRVRHGLEAHRYLWGHWPNELAEIDRTGWRISEPLAGGESGPYYYSRRGNGVLLLAPER